MTRNRLQFLKLTAAVLIAAASSYGCAGAIVNGTTLAVKSAQRDELLEPASAGDAQAQYELGNTHCCMGAGFDTQTATHWYCRAARQGHSGAMFELGRIYLGQLSRTPAPGQKLRQALAGKSSHAHAHVWLSLAADARHPNAEASLSQLKRKIDVVDLEFAQSLVKNWQLMPCEYETVFDAKENELRAER